MAEQSSAFASINNSRSNQLHRRRGRNINQSRKVSSVPKMLTECIEERNERARRFMAQHGFQVIDRNGQRISTNCANLPELNEPDQPYNEVFLGKLPRDLGEDELLPVLLEVGGIVKTIRFMMDFSGFNRGFAFVKFTTVADAAAACRLLDGRQLRPTEPPIGARISFDNKCLYFGNLPLNISAEQLVKALRKLDVPGVVSARLADGISFNGSRHSSHDRYGNPRQPPPPAGRFCHVDFESHDAATIARRMLLPGEVMIKNRKITIDWTKSEIPQEIQDLVRNPHAAYNNQSRKVTLYPNYIPPNRQQSTSIALYNHSYPAIQRNGRRTNSGGSNSGSNSSLNSNSTQRFCTEWHPMMDNRFNNNNNKFNI